jgi:hypothetical protein
MQNYPTSEEAARQLKVETTEIMSLIEQDAIGEYRWFLFCNNPLRDEQGRIERWYLGSN